MIKLKDEDFQNLLSCTLVESDKKYNSKRKKHLASSAFKDFQKGEHIYEYNHLSGECEHKETEALYFGKLAHMAGLEGEKAVKKAYRFDGPRNNDGEEYGYKSLKFQDARGGTKELATLKDYDIALKIRKSIHSHPHAKVLLENGEAERVVRVKYLGVKVQIKMDFLNAYGIIDLKTTADLGGFYHPGNFCDVMKYNYLTSAAFYRKALHLAAPEIPKQPFYFIAVEKSPPYFVKVWEVPAWRLDEYEDDNEEYLEKFKKCQELNAWANPNDEMGVME